MGREDNGLTLEGLAQRLEALQRENAENAQRLQTLERENEALRNKVATLREPGARQDEVPALRALGTRHAEEPTSESDGRVSRRWLLSKAGAAAVGAVAAGALLNPREAKANHFDERYFEADFIATHGIEANRDLEYMGPNAAVTGWVSSDSTGALRGDNTSSGPGVVGLNGGGGPAVEGISNGTGSMGVKGTGWFGVWGESNRAGFYGVTGRNTNTDGTGVRGVGTLRGVKGESTDGTGVLGESGRGVGVEGKGKNGVYGESSTPGNNGVWGRHTNDGAGVAGEGRVGVIGFSHEDGWNAVWGRHTTNGRGVAGDSAQGTGVLGASTSGYGGEFQGGKSQLRLVPQPAGTTGPPSGAHAKGEIYMDSAGTLFVCVRGGATPTWRQVSTTAPS